MGICDLFICNLLIFVGSLQWGGGGGGGSSLPLPQSLRRIPKDIHIKRKAKSHEKWICDWSNVPYPLKSCYGQEKIVSKLPYTYGYALFWNTDIDSMSVYKYFLIF